MDYAVIDCYQNKNLPIVRHEFHAEELDIQLPYFREKKSLHYAKKVLKLLNKAKINQVVLTNHLLQNRLFCNMLSSQRINVITGKKMFPCILVRALKDIAFQMNWGMEQWKVVMLMEEFSVQNMDLIRRIAKEVKLLTVVTTDKDKLEFLIKELYETYGIILKVLEKEHTSFKNCNVLINADFSSEDMNQIEIANDSLVICGFAKEYQLPPHFSGIVVRKIDIVDKNHHSNIDELSLCEAKIYHFQRKLRENDRVFEREGYKICGYEGENGKIRAEDFRKLGKKLSVKLLDKQKIVS